MRPFKPSTKKRVFIFVTIFLLSIFIATLASFLFFGIKEKEAKEVILKIQGPEEIASGEELTYILTIENQEKIILKNLEISLKFPRGFYWQSSKPASSNPLHTIYQWPELKPGKREKLEVKGQLIGQVNETKVLEARLIYQPINFHSDLEKKAKFSTKITSSTLEIDLQGPKKSLINQEVDYFIKLRNISQRPLGKIKVKAILPIDLEIKEIKPEPEEKNTWIFEKIKSEEEREIKIRGVLGGLGGQEKELKIQAGLLVEDEFILQSEEHLVTFLYAPRLSFDFTSSHQVAKWGDSIDYLVKFKNESNLEMADLNFQFLVLNSQISFKSSKISDLELQWKRENEIWKIEINNLEQIPALGLLKPKEGGRINLKINLPEDPQISWQNEILKIKIEVEVVLPELENQKIKFTSKTIEIKIQSKLLLRAEARYYDDNYQIIGAGPLPPKVGQKTLYRIYWFLENTTNEVKNIQIKASLPQEVSFLSLPSTGPGILSFDPISREVTWSIDKISPWQTDFQAAFQISLEPTVDQVGKTLVLLGPTTLEAQDQFTKTTLNLEIPALLSDLAFDPIAKGKGVVEK
jgi:hypothetical protein